MNRNVNEISARVQQFEVTNDLIPVQIKTINLAGNVI